ncbi:peptidase M35 [Massilia sp. KIM]|uniref:M35 family metallo-endopeptidase n=1 Tax=Massilia sp. KIM TaxID=1955422 RepID=UPI00098E94FF|nr:M35 family metallo-endopeptidase [Massilia sp. KIM]OON60993.1 peptidase M35 [Massilia sp. KIM]
MRLLPSSLVLVTLCACAAVQQTQASIAVKLEPVRPSVGRGDDVLVRVTLTNTAAVAQQVLRWRTPFPSVDSALFEVRRDGQPVRYLGRHVKRAAPGPEDYLRIEPGASLTRTVELSSLYEMHVTGTYTVRYLSPASPVPAGAAASAAAMAGELASAPVSIWVEGRLPRGARPSAPAPAAVEPGQPSLAFSKCSNSQQEQLVTAVEAGRAMAADAHAYLAAGQVQGQGQGEGQAQPAPAEPSYGPRYTTWFGAFEAQRAARVRANFTAIKDAFETKPLQIDCGCDEPYFAYVYPARPYTIYVCKAFWAAAPTGTDSRGGTLVHELSHFDVVAGTDDHVYGQAGAAELARSAPERAVNNADSHEYFGENTPAQQKR